MTSIFNLREVFGSPAHAGIDLSGIGLLLGLDGFPRTRGDRPPAI